MTIGLSSDLTPRNFNSQYGTIHKLRKPTFGLFLDLFPLCQPLNTCNTSAIAALKGQFVGHCYHSIVFSKGPQTFFGNFLG